MNAKLKFQSLLGKIIGNGTTERATTTTFQSLLGKIIVEYFTTYPLLYTTSCGCQVFEPEKTYKNFVKLPNLNGIMSKIYVFSLVFMGIDEVKYEQSMNKSSKTLGFPPLQDTIGFWQLTIQYPFSLKTGVGRSCRIRSG